MTEHDQWLAQVREDIVAPEQAIVDPHHHLWDRPNWRYTVDELWADTEDGHNITKTVFLECGWSYRTEGPEHLYPIGETEYVAAAAAHTREHADKATIAAIVARADLRLDNLDEVLDAHEAAGQGLFRGIRHAGAHALHPEGMMIPGSAPQGLYEDPDFRRGVARLGERGYTYDTWQYHYQMQDFVALAQAVPGTTMVLDHFSTPLGVGHYEGQREAIFEQWREDLKAVAECGNVIAKLGGLAMPDNGFGWAGSERPPTSDEFVTAQERYYHHAIECFGPERCMFESNFPVDRLSISYHVLWNGLKKIAARYTAAEQEALFRGTAERTYRI